MNFTFEQMVLLNEYAEKKLRVVACGKNGIGQDFKIDGYIMSGTNKDGDLIWLHESAFAMYVGQNNKETSNKQFMVMRTNIVDDGQLKMKPCM